MPLITVNANVPKSDEYCNKCRYYDSTYGAWCYLWGTEVNSRLQLCIKKARQAERTAQKHRTKEGEKK